jgi:DNA/RNA-binding domain of Phe-tRNA-synthetase-like protein
MNVSLAPGVFKKFSKTFTAGLIYCTGVDNKGDAAEIHEMLRDMDEYVRITFTPETAANHHFISGWKAAIEQLGHVEHYASNVESLLKNVLAGKGVKSQNKLIDICQFISLKYIMPVSSADLAGSSGDLVYSIAVGNERLIVGKKRAGVEKGEVILRDTLRVLSRMFSRATNTQIVVKKSSTSVLIHLEGVEPVSVSKMQKVVEELGALVKIFCKCTVRTAVLSERNKKVRF